MAHTDYVDEKAACQPPKPSDQGLSGRNPLLARRALTDAARSLVEVWADKGRHCPISQRPPCRQERTRKALRAKAGVKVHTRRARGTWTAARSEPSGNILLYLWILAGAHGLEPWTFGFGDRGVFHYLIDITYLFFLSHEFV